jgi:hypothetical protein
MMKRFAPLLLLFVFALVACQGSPVTSPDPQIPTATLKRSTPCALGGGTMVDAQTHYAGSRWVWDLYITFHTTQCASDVNVKVYFIYPGEPLGQGALDGRRKPIGAADAPVVDTEIPGFGTPHRAIVQLIMPKDWESYPYHWDMKFWVEVRSGGKLIGGFRTVDDGTPDFRHPSGFAVSPH